MALKIYLYLLFFLSIAFWIILGIIILSVNPYKSDLATFVVFFTALFGGICFSITLFGFYIRIKFLKNNTASNLLKSASRQGLLIALLIVGIMLFIALNILNLWTITLYFVILFLIELILKVK